MPIGKFRIYCLGFSLHVDIAIMYATEIKKKFGLNIEAEFARERSTINYAEALAIWMFPCDYRDDDDRSDVEGGARIHGVLIERFSTGKEVVDSVLFDELRAKYKREREAKEAINP